MKTERLFIKENDIEMGKKKEKKRKRKKEKKVGEIDFSDFPISLRYVLNDAYHKTQYLSSERPSAIAR